MTGVIGSFFETLLRPWRTTATWRALCHLALDAPIGSIVFSICFTLAVLSLSLIVILPAALLASWLLFVSAHGIARIERTRFAALLDLTLDDAHPTLTGATPWKRHVERLKSVTRWKEVAYTLVHYPLGILTTATAFGVWSLSVALISLPAVIGRLPGDTFRLASWELHGGAGPWILAAVGVVFVVLVAPWTTVGLAEIDRFVGRGLLGRTARSEFVERVTDLETSRTAAVDSAEAERRRIERDLHDGAQQRLIAVAMSLGIARQRLDDDPAQARELVGSAHDEVKSALKELRDLVRGIHPVILEDRGLDAALSAVVARCSVPVVLSVDVAPRPTPAVESAAYFIVSEALVNVVRHSQATAASVEIARRADRLTIAVADNGIGGAAPVEAGAIDGGSEREGGSGLRGLADRVSALDGWMQIVSPVGGPTTLLVEVPCGS